jgi:lipopolysaccharide transport system ATP-binding protein
MSAHVRAIAVSEVSKQYKLGQAEQATMLREALTGWLKRRSNGAGGGPKTMWALRNVSFDVQPGEVLGIIGRNGSGKSTLLKVLSRITRPTSGAVSVSGKVASLLEVGTGFHEELTGRENVFMSGSLLGMPKAKIEARLDEIVAFAGVETFIDTPIKRYSSGMRMRLGFSVAAHLESDVLLVDEVLAVGDSAFQKKCLDSMSALHNAGRTVLFVSHNLAAVENLCTRAIWLDAGHIRYDGAPAEAIRRYMATFNESRQNGAALDSITTRRGSGDARFTTLEFLDEEYAPKAGISSGDTVVLRMSYNARKRIERLIFGLEIYSHLGTLVAQAHTYNSGFDIAATEPGRGHMDVVLRDLNLSPGRYYVSLLLSSLGNVYYDAIDHCAILDVEHSSRYGLNRGLKGGSIVQLTSEWRPGPSLHCPDAVFAGAPAGGR